MALLKIKKLPYKTHPSLPVGWRRLEPTEKFRRGDLYGYYGDPYPQKLAKVYGLEGVLVGGYLVGRKVET